MTCSAGIVPSAVVDRKNRVREGCAFERGSRVARFAIAAIAVFVHRGHQRFGVARHARFRRALEDKDIVRVLVARLALDRRMLAGQLEAGQIVVEIAHAGRGQGSVGPGSCRMARRTPSAEAAQMHLRLGMARYTSLCRALVEAIDVAGLAIDLAVGAGQLEGSAIVVELGHIGQHAMRPLMLGMAAAALRSRG